MDKVISSPLRYWGGKRWLFKTVRDLIPEGTTEVFSPFLGGGSIEINLAYRGYTVHAYDNYAPVINFWHHWLDDPESVRRAVYEMLSLYSRRELKPLYANWEWQDNLQSTAIYLIKNRLSFSNKPDGFMHKYALRSDGVYMVRHNEKRKHKLLSNFDFWQSKPCETLNVNDADFEQVFWMHNHHFAYIDPPYFGNEKDYDGSRENGFNHQLLAELVRNRKKTIISYNDHPKAYELYDGFHIQPIRRGSDGKQELLILSPDIAERFEPKQLTLF